MTLIQRAKKGQETKTTNYEDMLSSTILNLSHIHNLFLSKHSVMAVWKTQSYFKVDQTLFVDQTGFIFKSHMSKLIFKKIFKKKICPLLESVCFSN